MISVLLMVTPVTHSLASSRSLIKRAMTRVAASSRYSVLASSWLRVRQSIPLIVLNTYREAVYAFLIVKDSSMIASYSDWSETRREGMDVCVEARGGRVLGSVSSQHTRDMQAGKRQFAPVQSRTGDDTH